LFIDHSSEAFVLLDPITRKVLEYNRHARDMFGIPGKIDDETVIADVFGQPDWHVVDSALVLKECATLGGYRRVRAYLTRTGKSFWGDLAAVLVKVGRRTLLLVRVADVTARKKLEERLASAETHFKLVEEKIDVVLARYGIDGTITQMSPSCQAIYGHGRSELMGKKIYDFIHPDFVEKVKGWLAGNREEDDYSVARYRISRKDGSQAWVEATSRKVRDSSTGEVKEVDTVVRDITDRIDLETGLEKS
jgi:two-component system sporulation sensor kinase A